MAVNRAGPLRSFAVQLGHELRKLVARPRTRFGFAAFFVVALVMLLLFQLGAVQRPLREMLAAHHYDPAHYFSGLTLTIVLLRTTVLLIGTLYVALVAGDIVAKEVEDGTLRMLLGRPVSRLRVLTVKWAASALHTFALTFFIGFTALGLGLLFAGAGGLCVYGPLERVFAVHEFAPGLARYLAALPLLALSLLTVHALAFALSCFDLKPAAATIAALTFFIADYVLRGVPFFRAIQDHFLAAKMCAWVQLFQVAIPWDVIVADYAVLLALQGTLFVIGWVRFEERDFKS